MCFATWSLCGETGFLRCSVVMELHCWLALMLMRCVSRRKRVGIRKLSVVKFETSLKMLRSSDFSPSTPISSFAQCRASTEALAYLSPVGVTESKADLKSDEKSETTQAVGFLDCTHVMTLGQPYWPR